MMPFTLADLVRRHPIARRLETTFDPSPLAADLEALAPDWWRTHQGPYHDGGWESVSLWAPRGDPFEQRSFGGALAATPALVRSPAIRAVLDAIPAGRNRIRLMRLGPGNRILEHRDPLFNIDPTLVRLHVPIITDPDVRFIVAGHRIVMEPGEVWHVDVRFPHAVENASDRARVHLVLDLEKGEELDAMLRRATPEPPGRLTGYFLSQTAGRFLRGRTRRATAARASELS